MRTIKNRRASNGGYNHQESPFFQRKGINDIPFFSNNKQPVFFGQGDHVPQNSNDEKTEVENNPQPVTINGQGTKTQNKIDYANCEGVTVQGYTAANYSNSFTATGTRTTAKNCEGCSGPQCITVQGNVVSVFNANPTVTLPSVPSGLSECETNAVQQFIDTTLTNHEQDHVDAFNTYDGTVTTPFTYTGCESGFNAYTQKIHDDLEVARRTQSNALSAALDPFNVTIPCDCPEPESEEAQDNE